MKVIYNPIKDIKILISDDGKVKEVKNDKTIIIRKKAVGTMGYDFYNGRPVRATKIIEEAIEIDGAKMMSEDDFPSDSNLVMTEEKIYANEDIYDEDTLRVQSEPIIKGLSRNKYAESQKEVNTNFAKGLKQK